MLSIHEILKKYWAYDAFRPLQEEIISSILSNANTIALLPTGAGKSLCYQVPALAIAKKTIVVSPLIALMQDQVNTLLRVGVPAAAIHSGMHYMDLDRTLDNFSFGDIKILYLSPERLKSKLFLDRLPNMDIGLIVIDEAHCISQWGYDFRPPYLEIAEIKTYLPNAKMVALTATATDMVVNDIALKLEMKNPQIFRQSFMRTNLGLVVIQCQDKFFELSQLLTKTKGSIIIYVRNRKGVIELANWVHQQGISCVPYHAGMDKEKKDRHFRGWMDNHARVVVCTNAFGMGIDKPDVRMVIHMDIPPSIEEYYQEVGRGGRDGKMAYGVILVDDQNYVEALENVADQYPTLDYIGDIMDSLYDYYDTDFGGGQYVQHIFDMPQFCVSIKQPSKKVHHTLNILEREGWIVMSEALKEPSKIMIKSDHTQLRFSGKNAVDLQNIITHLLRTYEGLFIELVKIDEERIARETNIDGDLLVRLLHMLDYDDIIEYKPKVDAPQITFLQPRVIKKSFSIDRKSYTKRKTLAEQRINSIISLLRNETDCRQRLITAYFGEKSITCSVCDNCIAKDEKALSDEQLNIIKTHLFKILNQKPINIRHYLSAYPFNKRARIKAEIHTWATEHIIDIDNQGFISIP
jgi:ATP-dependent DNA helicase RecQ